MGALVNSVEKGGPAEKAGVEAGDIVLKADGREVRTSSELPRIVTMIKAGQQGDALDLAQGGRRKKSR
jgi:serine protease Do